MPDLAPQEVPGTMLEWCSITVVRTRSPSMQVAAAKAVRDEVDRLGRAPDEDDLVRVVSVEELGHAGPGRLVGGGRLLRSAGTTPRWTFAFWVAVERVLGREDD